MEKTPQQLGAEALNASLTPEQRSENARKASLAGAVQRVVNAWPELTPEQRDRLAGLLRPTGRQAVQDAYDDLLNGGCY